MDLPFPLLFMDITSHGRPCDSFWLILSLTTYNLNTISTSRQLSLGALPHVPIHPFMDALALVLIAGWRDLNMTGQNGSHFKTTTHLDSFLTLYKSKYLVLGISSFGLDNCFNPSRHTFYPFLTLFLINISPLLHYFFLQLVNSCKSTFITWEAFLEVIPGIFNGTKVWRLCRPVQKLDFLFFKSFLGSSRGILGIIILLKDNVIFWNFRFPHALQ